METESMKVFIIHSEYHQEGSGTVDFVTIDKALANKIYELLSERSDGRKYTLVEMEVL